MHSLVERVCIYQKRNYEVEIMKGYSK